MTRVLLACLLASVIIWHVNPARGQQVSAHEDGPCFGRLLITNHATGTTNRVTDHDIAGIAVAVDYTSTPNYLPPPQSHDIIIVSVPEGFMAVPSDIVLEEGGTVEVLICEALLG